MPCGGIYPVSDGAHYPCWQCNEKGSDHFVEEWDAFLHEACIIPFLHTAEGEIVLAHRHYIQVGMLVLQEEDGELMDPNVTLNQIRELVRQLSGPAVDGRDALTTQLLDKVENLDGWISHGGFLPADWDGKTK